ncbi:MAG TPA: c-type cytochrome [Bryobacteraceae bacterium]
MSAGLVLGAGLAAAQALPNAPGKDTVERICGACHSPNMVLGHGMTREQWSNTVSQMIARGAKGTPAEFNEVIDYLAKNLAPGQVGNAAANQTRTQRRFPAGPADAPPIDPTAAARGKTLFAKECAGCHGPLARGTGSGPDLVRSVTVLHDRYGDKLGPLLRTNHPLPGGKSLPSLTEAQVKDLSNFLHQQVLNTLRSGPYSKVLNVLTGDPKAGEAYFNGAGHCNQCHSPTGDLAHVASRYDPPTLQQRFLFPQATRFSHGTFAPAKPVTVSVTTPDGRTTSGTLVSIDDFNVSLHDANGYYHSWKRTPNLKIAKHDPYAAHDKLLDQYTDEDIHNVVAYLETLK